MICLIFALIWIACGILGYGILFADIQGDFPSGSRERKRDDMGASFLLGGLLGPFGLFVAFFASGFAKHGLKFK